jgi:VanZ family protein
MKKYIYLTLTGLWLVFIFFNSMQPAADSSAASSFFVDIANSVLTFFGVRADLSLLSLLIRKCAHIFEFFILTLLFFGFAGQIHLRYRPVLALSFTMLMALSDETIQYFSEGRVSSVIDVFIDMIGAAAAIGIIYLFIAARKKSKSVLNNN